MDSLDQLNTKLASASSLLILLPPNPEPGLLTASQTLNDALVSAGKHSLIGCSTSGIEGVQTTIGNQTLVVSFDYREDAVENVSYDIDDQTKKFNLRIQPRAGQKPLGTQNLQFNYTGANADLVFTLGVNSLEELGSLYADEKAFLDAATIASLLLGNKPSSFAALNLNFPVSSYTEAVAVIIKAIGLKLDPQTASELFQQLSQSTHQFAGPHVTADTFELAAFLLKNGARQPSVAPFSTPPLAIPTTPPTVNSPIPVDLPAGRQDWTGPKIFRGGSPLR